MLLMCVNILFIENDDVKRSPWEVLLGFFTNILGRAIFLNISQLLQLIDYFFNISLWQILFLYCSSGNDNRCPSKKSNTHQTIKLKKKGKEKKENITSVCRKSSKLTIKKREGLQRDLNPVVAGFNIVAVT